MPATAVANLTKAEASKVPGCADSKDVLELKQALRNAIIRDYTTFREANDAQILPGVKVYTSVTDQVNKY